MELNVIECQLDYYENSAVCALCAQMHAREQAAHSHLKAQCGISSRINLLQNIVTIDKTGQE